MRIGIVNDVALAREALRRAIATSAEHEVAWMAEDGNQAVAMCAKDKPDLVLMDLIMPNMDGAEATRQIMARSPCPILVVTATVSGNMNKVFQAMGYGALDAVNTPAFTQTGKLIGAPTLLEKIQTIGRLTGKTSPTRSAVLVSELLVNSPSGFQPTGMRSGLHPAGPSSGLHPTFEGLPLVLIGSSTGGPQALAQILPGLPADLPAGVVVAQHVDAEFVGGLSAWLDEKTLQKVKLAERGDKPAPRTILLSATNDHLILTKKGTVDYTAEPRECPYRPSINVLFRSAAVSRMVPGVAVLLTGMGRDGAEGLLGLRAAGWHTIAQDEKTSVVYGMPKAAAELGAAVEVLAVERIAEAIVREVGQMTQFRSRSKA